MLLSPESGDSRTAQVRRKHEGTLERGLEWALAWAAVQLEVLTVPMQCVTGQRRSILYTGPGLRWGGKAQVRAGRRSVLNARASRASTMYPTR